MYEANLLGMTIMLIPWLGIDLKPIYKLIAYTIADDDWIADCSPELIKLDLAVIDLLHRKGAGNWHEPTPEELRAEASAEVLAAMQGEEKGPPDDWPTD